MKMKTILYSAFLASSLFAQAYDTVFTGGSGANYNWNDPANWSNGVPSESSKVLIELEGLSNNNLVISGVAAVDEVVWNVTGEMVHQKGLAAGGTLKANSITIDGGNYWNQFYSDDATFDATNESGTGTMTLKTSNNSLYFRASYIKADILNCEKGAYIEVKNGGSNTNPIIDAGTANLSKSSLFNVTGTSGNFYIRLGGITGQGEITVKDGDGTAAGYIELTNSQSRVFDGKISLSNPNWGGSTNKSVHLTMNGSAGAVQHLSNSENELTSVTVNSGELSMVAKNAGAISLAGGTLSVYDSNGTITDNVLNADSMSWSGGTVKLAIGIDFNSQIALSGAFSKGENADGLAIELEFADGVAEEFSALLETQESIVRELITYESSDFGANGASVSVSGPAGFSYELLFGGNALSVSITQVPEPATFAAIFGVAALALATARRRKIR